MAQQNQNQIQGQMQPNIVTNRIQYPTSMPLNAMPMQQAASLGQMRVNVVNQPGANSGLLSPHAIGVVNYSMQNNVPMTNRPMIMVGPPNSGAQVTTQVVPQMISHGLNQVVVAPKVSAPRPIPTSANTLPVNFTAKPVAVPMIGNAAMGQNVNAPRPAPVPVVVTNNATPASPKQHIINLNNIPPQLWPQFQQQIMKQLAKSPGSLNTPEDIAKFSQGYKEFLTQSYHMSAGKPKLPASPPPQGGPGAAPAKYVLTGSILNNISVDTSSMEVVNSPSVATPDGEKDEDKADKKEKKKRVGLEWTLREKVQLKKTIARWGTTFNEQVSFFPGRNASSLRNYYKLLGASKGYYKPALSAHYRLKKTNQLESFTVALTPEEEAAIERNEDVHVLPEEDEPAKISSKLDEEDEEKSESDTSEREIKIEDPYAGLTEEQKKEKMNERAELIFQANKRGIYWGNSLDLSTTESERKRKITSNVDDTVIKKRKFPIKTEPRTPSERPSIQETSPAPVMDGEKKLFSFGALPYRAPEHYLTPVSSLSGSMTFKEPKFIAAPKQPVKPAVKQPPVPAIKKATPFNTKGMNLNELKKSATPGKPQSASAEPQKTVKQLPLAVKLTRTDDVKKIKSLLQEALVKTLHKRPEQALDQLVQSNIYAAIIDKSVITGIIRHETEKEEEDRVVPYQAIEACKLKFNLDSTKQITSCLVRDRSGPNQWHESTLFPIDSVIALTPFDTSIIAVGSKNEVNIYEVSEAAEGKQVMKLLGHSNKITALQFSSKGNLASADESGMIRVWQYQQLRRPKYGQNKQLITQLSSAYQSLKDTNTVTQLHWAQHGEVLLSVGNSVIKVWDMVTGSIRPKYAIEAPSRVNSLCLKPKTADERATRWLVVAPATTAEMQGQEQSALLIYDMIRDRTSPTKFELSNMLDVTSVAFNPAASQFCYVLQASNTAKPLLTIVSIVFPAETNIVAAQPAAKPVATVLQRYEYSPLHESFVLVGSDRADESMEDVSSVTFTSGQLFVNTNGNLLVATLTSETGDNKAVVFSLVENSKLEAIYK